MMMMTHSNALQRRFLLIIRQASHRPLRAHVSCRAGARRVVEGGPRFEGEVQRARSKGEDQRRAPLPAPCSLSLIKPRPATCCDALRY